MFYNHDLWREESTGDTVPKALVESPKAITAISVIWQKKVGGGVFIIFFMGPRWTSWQPCLWLRIHFKIVNHNKWKLRCVTVLDFNMFRVLLSLHLQSFLHGACHFIITFDSAASPFVFTSSDVSPFPSLCFDNYTDWIKSSVTRLLFHFGSQRETWKP